MVVDVEVRIFQTIHEHYVTWEFWRDIPREYLMRFDIQREPAQYVADVVALIAINFIISIGQALLVDHSPIAVHRTRYSTAKSAGVNSLAAA